MTNPSHSDLRERVAAEIRSIVRTHSVGPTVGSWAECGPMIKGRWMEVADRILALLPTPETPGEGSAPVPTALPDGCFQMIEEEDLQQRIAKLRSQAPLINSLMIHFKDDFEAMMADFAERNPKLKAEALTRMGVREVTIYVDAAPVAPSGEGRP